MSTRACYTFLDTFSRGETRSFHVYKHHDGYPYAQCHTVCHNPNDLLYSRELSGNESTID